MHVDGVFPFFFPHISCLFLIRLSIRNDSLIRGYYSVYHVMYVLSHMVHTVYFLNFQERAAVTKRRGTVNQSLHRALEARHCTRALPYDLLHE